MKINFINYYKKLSRAEKTKFRRAVMEACKIEYYTFNNWLYSGTSIPALAQEKITKIIGTNIFI